MSARLKTWGLVLVCLVLAQSAASVFLPARTFALTAFSDLLQSALLLVAALSCVPHIVRTSGRSRLFWLLMALGFTSWLTYQLLWTYIEVLKQQEVPNLFTGDVILFLHIVPMMAAQALRPDVRQEERELRLGSLDFALLLLWWLFVYVYTVIPWQYVFADELAYNHNLNQAYLAEKLALLGGLGLLWRRSSGPWKVVYAHWFGASLLYSSSSYVANWAVARNTYYSGSLYDLPLITSMAWMGLPGLLALNAPLHKLEAAKSLPRGVWTARLGMLAVFSLPTFAWVSYFEPGLPSSVRAFRMLVTLAAMVLMGGMVFLKQHFLDIELIRSLRSSRQALEDLQLLQSQLVQSEKLASLGQLVGGAAHELNNPLTAMLGFSELLSTTELSAEQRSLTDKISLQVQRIRTLVGSLLSFARQTPSAKSDVDVNVVIETALKLCQPQTHAANVRVCSNLGSSVRPVHGDANQLLQVFNHIISNASHAMADQRDGLLTVTTGASALHVTVQFFDNGPGMADPARVFDPFYTTRPVGQGRGLGLSMCYGIIQEHGGKITCRNRPEGGASFLIELPSAEAYKNQKAQAQASKA
ncbi:MAG: HAMP domain-containing histidine kinase [Acidobacteria bacterium]|nr:HAMP domain-containing histidine kinase [Acidobacteriota bacterium]